MEFDGVCEGGGGDGGVRGIALAGAAYATLAAAPFIAGCGSNQLEEEVAGLNWRRLLHRTAMASLPLLGKHLALMTHKDAATTDRMEAVWSRLLPRRGVRTFCDPIPGASQVVATDLTYGAGVAFTQPHRSVYDQLVPVTSP